MLQAEYEGDYHNILHYAQPYNIETENMELINLNQNYQEQIQVCNFYCN
jgi:hypothetical protein